MPTGFDSPEYRGFREAIENDDLDAYLALCRQFPKFSPEHTPVAEILNYASGTRYCPGESKDLCESLKYAVHCQADKIFFHLLSRNSAEPNPNKPEYGWPCLACAIALRRFDYARAIIAHPNFDFSCRPHTNSLRSGALRNGRLYDGNEIPEKDRCAHIEYIGDYLSKLHPFAIESLLSTLFHPDLSERDYFLGINRALEKKGLDIFKLCADEEDQVYALREIFCSGDYSPELASAVPAHFYAALNKMPDCDSAGFLSFFMREHTEGRFELLLEKAPDFLLNSYKASAHLTTYLDFERLRLLESAGFDLFAPDAGGVAACESLFLRQNPKPWRAELTRKYFAVKGKEILEAFFKTGEKIEDYPVLCSLAQHAELDTAAAPAAHKTPKIL